MCVLSLRRVQQGFDTVMPSVSCNRQFLVSILVPVTTFLKVACGDENDPGGYGTVSAVECRQHSSVDTTRHSSLVFGQGNNSSLGATVEKRGPSNYIQTHFAYSSKQSGNEGYPVSLVHVKLHISTLVEKNLVCFNIICLCRSTDRIPRYERDDRSSIPSRDAKISHSLILD